MTFQTKQGHLVDRNSFSFPVSNAKRSSLAFDASDVDLIIIAIIEARTESLSETF